MLPIGCIASLWKMEFFPLAYEDAEDDTRKFQSSIVICPFMHRPLRDARFVCKERSEVQFKGPTTLINSSDRHAVLSTRILAVPRSYTWYYPRIIVDTKESMMACDQSSLHGDDDDPLFPLLPRPRLEVGAHVLGMTGARPSELTANVI